MEEKIFRNTPGKVSRLGRLIGAILVVVLVAIFLVSLGSLWENVPAGNICVIQSPISGELTIHFDPGMKWQGYGKVTMYPRSGIYEFLSPVDPDDETENKKYRALDDKSIKIQFNDSGAGWISGSMRYDYPLTVEEMTEIHKKFQGHENVINGLIKPNIERVINMTGPLMSSIESSRTRRAEIPFYVEDQIQQGLYLTVTRDEKVKDEITGEETTNKVAVILKDENGNPRRQSSSIITDSGMRAYNINMNKLSYEKKVLARLDDLFKADSEKQISYMKAIKAEQDKKTAEEEGKAAYTTAEWKAKEITATEKEKAERDRQVQVIDAERSKQVAVISAERNREVAELEKQTAALYKDATLLRAEADAEARRKMMTADGALDKKLEAYVETQKIWAQSMSQFKGNLVPTIVAGGGDKGSPSGLDFIQLMSIKAAKDLALDFEMKNN